MFLIKEKKNNFIHLKKNFFYIKKMNFDVLSFKSDISINSKGVDSKNK